ncbi:MAG: GNAT family N-acetyltransferase [Pontibacterium sp.]
MNKPADIQLRHAREEEIDQIYQLWQKLDTNSSLKPFGGDGPDKADRTHALIRHSVLSDNAIALVALTNGKLIGTVSAYLYDKPAVQLPRIAVLYCLWIEPQYRHRGLAHQLVYQARLDMQALGAQSLQVAWDSDNKIAQTFWKKEGFDAYEVIAGKTLI